MGIQWHRRPWGGLFVFIGGGGGGVVMLLLSTHSSLIIGGRPLLLSDGGSPPASPASHLAGLLQGGLSCAPPTKISAGTHALWQGVRLTSWKLLYWSLTGRQDIIVHISIMCTCIMSINSLVSTGDTGREPPPSAPTSADLSWHNNSWLPSQSHAIRMNFTLSYWHTGVSDV